MAITLRRVARLSAVGAGFAAMAATVVSLAGAGPAWAASPYQVNLGYADTLRANPAHFPTPWAGSPNVVYQGCTGCTFDSGAIQIVNTQNTAITVDSVTVDLSSCHYDIWPHGVTVPAGGQLIDAQPQGGNGYACPGTAAAGFDSSDIGPSGNNWAGNCAQSGVIPQVTVSVNGTSTLFPDSGQILNTGGFDKGACATVNGTSHPFIYNESEPWTPVGNGPCPTSTLSLAPASKVQPPSGSITFTATLTACQHPLQGASIFFNVVSGPDAGTNASATTSSTGKATFNYTNNGQQGIDFVQASTNNGAGTITSPTSYAYWERASLSLNPTTGLPGATINYTGSGYAAGETVNLYANSVSGQLLASTTASGTGTISGTFQIPQPSGGGAVTEVVAHGVTSGNEGWAFFTAQCTDAWTNTAGGDFNNAANWSTGAVPLAGDSACIIANGTYKVTMTTNHTLGSLLLGTTSGTGTQTLDVLANSGNGDVHLQLNALSTVSATGVLKLDASSANNTFLDGAGPVSIRGALGTVTSTGGSGTRFIRTTLISSGHVNILAPTIQDAGTTTTNVGAFTVYKGYSYIVQANSSNVFAQSGGTLANNGTVIVAGATFTESGGTGSGTAVVIQSTSLVDSGGTGAFLVQCNSNGLSGTQIASGQTITVQANGCGDAHLAVNSAMTNNGSLVLDAISGNGSFLDGPDGITNNGTVSTTTGTGGGPTRYIRTNLTNASGGTVTIGAGDTRQDSGTATTNNGAFTVAAGGGYTVENNSTNTFTQSGGTLTNNGSLIVGGATFTQSGGTGSGTAVVISGSSLVDSAGAGAFLVQCNGNGLSGSQIPSGQTVTIQANGCGDAHLAVNSAMTNNGSLVLDTTGGSSSSLDGPDAVTNHGTVSTTVGGGGVRFIRTNLTNASDGTVTINAADTRQDSGTATTNNGSFAVATGGQYEVLNNSSNSFTQSGGTLTNNGTLIVAGATFTESGGAGSGTAVVIQSTSLVDSGGTGAFLVQCNNNGLSGSQIPSGQTVTIQANGCGDAHLAVNSAMTNNGSLVLDAISGNGSYLDGPDGITNNGTVSTTTGTGGSGTRYIRTNLTNATGGTVNITAADTRQDNGTATTNNGAFTVAAGGGYTVENNNTNTFTQSAGTLTNNGTVIVAGATFTESGGTGSGTAVVIQSSSLVDSGGTGAFLVQCSGNGLSGSQIPSGQTVTIQANGCGDAHLAVNSAMTNNGSLVLDAISGNGSFLDGPDAITNNGTVSTTTGTGGSGTRYIRTNLTNATGGTVTIGAADTRQDNGTATTNNGSFTVATGDQYEVLSSSSNSFTQSGGTLTNNGSLFVGGATFTESGGTGSGHPVVISGTSLVDSGGTGAFLVQCGGNTLSGTQVPSNQTITVQANGCGDAHLAVSGSVPNHGTLVLDSTSGNNSFLDGPGTITNDWVINAIQDAGGIRFIRAGIVNASGAVINITAADTRQDAGTGITNNGIVSVYRHANLNLCCGSSFTQGGGGRLNVVVDATAGKTDGIIGSGSISLAGKLGVTTFGTPTSGTAYTVITGSAVSGTFSAVVSPVTYSVGYTPTSVTLTH